MLSTVNQLMLLAILVAASSNHVSAFPEMIGMREPEGIIFEGPLQRDEPQLIAPLPHLQRRAEKAMRKRQQEKRDLSSSSSAASDVMSDSPTPSLSSQSVFCMKNRKQYEHYCLDFFADIPMGSRDAITRFCPLFENRCIRIN